MHDRLLSENGFSVIDSDETDLELKTQPLTTKA